jgi:hypothetical protein
MAASIEADARDLAPTWKDLTAEEKSEARQAMEVMGVTAKRARQILAGYAGGKYLRRGIAGALAWNFEIQSLEEANRTLAWCRKTIRAKEGVSISEKVEIVKAMGTMLGSIARLCDASISAAAKFEQVEVPPQPEQKSVMVGVSVNNFPPVAQIPARANTGISNPVTEGDGDAGPL